MSESGNEQEKLPKNTEGQAKQSLLEQIAQLTALVTGVAAIIYVLGVVALWGPISRVYTHDIATAASAVSLVPKFQVAGLGVAVIVGPALLSIVLLAAFLALSLAQQQIQAYFI